MTILKTHFVNGTDPQAFWHGWETHSPKSDSMILRTYFANTANPQACWPEREPLRPKKMVQEISSGLVAKASVLTDPSFYAPLSFVCLSLTTLGDFSYQTTCVLMKIFNFQQDQLITQRNVLWFLCFAFTVYTLVDHECFCLVIFSIRSLHSCGSGLSHFCLIFSLHSLYSCRVRVSHFCLIFSNCSLYSYVPRVLHFCLIFCLMNYLECSQAFVPKGSNTLRTLQFAGSHWKTFLLSIFSDALVGSTSAPKSSASRTVIWSKRLTPPSWFVLLSSS